MELMKESYYLLLDSPLWKRFRREYLLRVGYKCQICGSERRLQVHHRRYYAGMKPWEYSDDDLMCLCTDCHRKVHLDLIDAGRKIPVYDSGGNPLKIPDDAVCSRCGGTGFMEDFTYLLGGICFYCFGTGMRHVHYYTEEEAKVYGLKLYNQRLAHREKMLPKGEAIDDRSPEGFAKWLLSMNSKQ